ncbi:unnamed protein product [Orchesella dallaii]|uniref:Homeobox domain-containing protein n=1 Tax=Orchesella dallaii TaxID=48710 RepID=A0ABP1RFI6_9HEXA
MANCYNNFSQSDKAVAPNRLSKVREVPEYIRVIITTDSHGRKRELLIPASLDLDRPKRPRITFQNWQIDAMEQEFQNSPFITEEKRKLLAKTLGITETQVKVWFQNRRTKVRNAKY